MGEVEAQLVGADRRARLADVGPQTLAKRRVKEMGRRVVSHRRVAGRALDLGLHPCAGGGNRPVHADHLVIADAIHVGDPRSLSVPANHAGVGDLAAALGVERRGLQDQPRPRSL